MYKSQNKYNLTEGGILKKIFLVAVPVIGTQLMQMAYNLTDMFWLARVGSSAVAASGAAGMYMWLAMGFLLVGRMGGEIGVAQNLGKGDIAAARDFSRNALVINLVLGVCYGLALVFGADALARFFPVGDEKVLAAAALYLRVIGIGILPMFFTAVISGTFTASGNSRAPFIINGAGLLCNMILDPVCIFLFGMGILGAALATVVSQILVCVLMLIAVTRFRNRPFETYSFRFRPDYGKIKAMLKWSVPIGLESLLFCFLTMLCSRMEARFGVAAMAAGKIGSQIESLTWLVGGGFGSALVSFIGQNYGAGKMDRIRRGVKLSLALMGAWGALVTIFFLIAGKQVFFIFLPDPEIAELGKRYLWILAACHIPMNLEAVWAGDFKGRGITVPPSVASIVSNSLKPVLAWFLSRTALGLYGVWAGISAGDTLRGILLFFWHKIAEKKSRKQE
ncbi:MAG: MATE family efflux transporter [Treponema sp.]|jgi:putative MATE family efflux protein|nr:MATE family efflux transporter [Treponema sp.]